MNDIIYKKATINDLSAIEKVGDTLFDYSIKKESAVEFLTDPRHHLILAFDNDTVVGMASGVNYIHPDKDQMLFINEVGVIDAYQNKGIGRKLVQLLVEFGRAIGCKEAWVGTEVSNIAARKVYAAAGGVEDKSPFILINFK